MYFLAYFGLDFQFLPLEARGLLLCPERQSKQNALLCHRSERSHNHRQSQYQLIFSLPFLLTFAECSGRYLSVIIPFLLSASRVVFSPIPALRKVLLKLRRSFLLSHSHSLVFHASLSYIFTVFYSDIRWSLLCAFLWF